MNENPFTIIIDQLHSVQAELSALRQELKALKETPSTKRRTGVPLAQEVTGLAKSTIYNLVCARKIPHYKKNGKLIFDETELRQWWLAGKRETLEELAA